MKAICVHKFGGPEVLKYEEVPNPMPGLNQVLIRARAIGVNPVETYLRSGSNPKLPLPNTPGKDCAGEVLAIGNAVANCQIGDRVYTSDTVTGSYAEFVLCEAADVHLLPEKISFPQGAALNVPYGTAYRALFQRAQGKAGETVLVHGASGGVGTAAVQLARAAGLTVIGTVGTAKGAELAKQSGAHFVFDHTKPDYLADIMMATHGHGVDIILEMLSNVNLGKDLTIAAMNGRIIVIGSRGKVEIDARDAMKRDVDIRGMMLANSSEKEKTAIHAGILAGLENGTLNPVISQQFPLAEAAKAHEAVLKSGAYGKIILLP